MTYLTTQKDKTTFQLSPTESMTFWVTGAETNNAFTYVEGTLGYLDGPPLHMHTQEDEWVHILEGEVRYKIGDEIVDAKAGDMVFLPRNVPHSFTNVRREKARVVGVINSDFYPFYSALMEKMKAKASHEELHALAEKYGNKLLGPPLAVMFGLAKESVST